MKEGRRLATIRSETGFAVQGVCRRCGVDGVEFVDCRVGERGFPYLETDFGG